MKDKLLHILRSKPVFLYLLPVFFVLHGFTENYDFIPVRDATLLTLVYLGVSVLFALLFWILYRNFTKANLAAFSLMLFNFFFGSVHDFLKRLFDGAFITKYIIILPGAFILFILLFWLLKKSKSEFPRLRYYLNVLLTVLILVDIVFLSAKVLAKKKPDYSLPEGFVSCPGCPKPDVYFILADEYAGNEELVSLFNY